jgi:LysM domain
MTRETKIGLLVAGSFLCLVAVVVASKWRGGDGGDAEEQTVTPGAVLHPAQNSTDTKSNGKGEPPPKPAPVAAAQPRGKETKKENKQEDGKPKGLPGLNIAPGVTAVEEAAILKESEKERQQRLDELAKKIEEEKRRPAAVGSLPPLPTGEVGSPPPLPNGDLGSLPPLPNGNVGSLPPLPNGQVGKLAPDQPLTPLPTAGEVQTPEPKRISADERKKGIPPPGAIGSMELQTVKPFDEKKTIADLPKPSPFDQDGNIIPAKQNDAAPTPKGPTIGQLAPLPEPTKPVIPFDDPKPPPPAPRGQIDNPAPGPIAVIPPTGGTLLPAPPIIVGGGLRPLPAVKDVNTDLYECQKGDTTFVILSLRMYGSDKYADALLQYNREHVGMVKNGSSLNVNPPILSPGQQVLKPPQSTLDREYGSLIRTAPPQVRVDAPLPLTPTPGPIAKVSNPPRPGPGGTYTVQNPNGESILDIAERVLGDRSQWHKIYRVNPNYPPQNRIPAGTTLTLPSD